MKRIKKLLVGALTLIIMCTASISLFGCKNDQALTFAKAYDYSAIAGIGLLKTQVAENGTQGLSAKPLALDTTEKEEIIGNLAIAQNLANNGFVKTEITTSNREGFEYYYTLKATDYTGAENEYAFYYNRTDITSREDLKENEQEYRLDGLVIFDGVEYTMVGKQEIEDKETEFSFNIALDNNNYVVIEQETEKNEIGYEYTAYKNGVKVFETEVEFEVSRNGDVELQFEIFDRENNTYNEYEYEFFTRGDDKYARVKIIERKKTRVLTTVKITETANGYVYEFVND